MIKILLLFSLSLLLSSDYESKLAELNESHQNCLDEGKFMMDCSMDFYDQLEDLMDLFLCDFQKNETKEKSDSLLQDQKLWEKRVQPEFLLINQNLDSMTATNGAVPLDELMFAYSSRARLIEDRINQLILILK